MLMLLHSGNSETQVISFSLNFQWSTAFSCDPEGHGSSGQSYSYTTMEEVCANAAFP